MTRVILCLVLLACALSTSPSATAIVVLRSPAGVVLAADSMAQTQSAGDDIHKQTACKIHPAGDRWWSVVAGFMRSTNPVFDVQDLVGAAMAPARTLGAAGDALMGQVYPKVATRLERDRDSPGFARMFGKAGQLISAIIIAGTDADTPRIPRVGVLTIALQSVEPFQLTPGWHVCPGAWCPDGRIFYGASVRGPAVDLLLEPRPPWVERGDAAAGARLIREQIQATPNLVGAPIDVLQIDMNGAKWIGRDKASTCAAVMSSTRP